MRWEGASGTCDASAAVAGLNVYSTRSVGLYIPVWLAKNRLLSWVCPVNTQCRSHIPWSIRSGQAAVPSVAMPPHFKSNTLGTARYPRSKSNVFIEFESQICALFRVSVSSSLRHDCDALLQNLVGLLGDISRRLGRCNLAQHRVPQHLRGRQHTDQSVWPHHSNPVGAECTLRAQNAVCTVCWQYTVRQSMQQHAS